MALFFPSTMTRFPVEDMPVKLHYGGTETPTMPMFHFKGNIGELMEILRVENEGQASRLPQYLKVMNSSRWAGLESGETIPDMLRTAHCETAFKAFETETGKIRTNLTRAKPELSIVGSAFSVGRVMIGHPKAAFRRPKTRLPAKRVELAISVSGSVDHKDISRSMARIVNAAYRYHEAGGPVTLRVHYLLMFHVNNPETGSKGLVCSLDIPLTSGSLAAFGGSVQFFRAFAIPLAQALSGTAHDSLQCGQYNDPRIIGIHGRSNDAEATIKALQIE